MCRKQTSVSHSSAESEIISLDAGLRMDVIFALDLWDVMFEAFESKLRGAAGNCVREKTMTSG